MSELKTPLRKCDDSAEVATIVDADDQLVALCWQHAAQPIISAVHRGNEIATELTTLRRWLRWLSGGIHLEKHALSRGCSEEQIAELKQLLERCEQP